MRMLSNSITCIKIRDAFTTHIPCKHILMSINKRVDACCSKSIYKAFNLIQIGIIIYTSSPLNCFPHNSESYKVESPFFKVLDVTVSHRILGIKCVARWDIRVNFIDDIHTMEND